MTQKIVSPGFRQFLTRISGQASSSSKFPLKYMRRLADFLAGVWAHHAQRTKNILEEGDIEEAMNASEAVGDDRIQMKSQGYVVPDAFTHGTSEQRRTWFLKGFQTGDMNQGDTFSED